MRISSLYRYPVKGLSPERLSTAKLPTDGYFPGDRLFAIENGPSGFDAANPEHQPKLKFFMLMRHEALARLTTRYDDVGGVLTITHEGKIMASGDLATTAGRQNIADAITSFMPEAVRGPASTLAAPEGFRFTDSRSGYVSLINLASVSDLEARMDAAIDPLRFRGNIHLTGLKPWAEFDLVGKVLVSSRGVRLEITKRIDRCAATSVDPATGTRDLPIVKTLMTGYGHVDCGVYARIISGGTLSEGEHFTVEAQREKASPGIL
jgi:uncharacterized protein